MANGQLGQRTPGHRVLLAGGGLARPVERLCGPQVPRYSQHQALPRFQESRTRLTITGRCTGLLTTFRGSASDTPARFPRHLSCRQARPAGSTAAVNCRQVQQWTEDLAGRLAEHAQGRGARLMSVIREARIGVPARAHVAPGPASGRSRGRAVPPGASLGWRMNLCWPPYVVFRGCLSIILSDLLEVYMREALIAGLIAGFTFMAGADTVRHHT